MGHAVLTTARLDQVMPFYTDILGFRLSDYILRPFFHLNPPPEPTVFTI
jgi:catechol 2,3-dioxygenase-like lactoylglutathione lyase family enzyme